MPAPGAQHDPLPDHAHARGEHRLKNRADMSFSGGRSGHAPDGARHYRTLYRRVTWADVAAARLTALRVSTGRRGKATTT
ncbi:hypothetical protein AB0H29_26245 [Streptomyces thermolilacinus]